MPNGYSDDVWTDAGQIVVQLAMSLIIDLRQLQHNSKKIQRTTRCANFREVFASFRELSQTFRNVRRSKRSENDSERSETAQNDAKMMRNGARMMQNAAKMVQNNAIGIGYRPGMASASAIDSLLGGWGGGERSVACFLLVLNSKEVHAAYVEFLAHF